MNMLEIVKEMMKALGELLIVLENNHFAAVVLIALVAILATVLRRPARK